MILYGSSVSPYVRKVLAYAGEKGIELETQNIGYRDPNPDFRAASPFAKMPALRDGDFTVADSTAIITFLEDTHPEPNMIPTDPKAKARTIWFEEVGDTMVCGVGGKVFQHKLLRPKVLKVPYDESIADAALADDLPPVLDYLEGVIPESGWLVEDRITLADIAVTTGFVNMMHCGFNVDEKTHPTLAAYLKKMLARPSFANWVEREKKFFEKILAPA